MPDNSYSFRTQQQIIKNRIDIENNNHLDDKIKANRISEDHNEKTQKKKTLKNSVKMFSLLHIELTCWRLETSSINAIQKK